MYMPWKNWHFLGEVVCGAAFREKMSEQTGANDYFLIKNKTVITLTKGSDDEIFDTCAICSTKNAAREVNRMAYEILKSIVEAEARAVEIKKQAVVQAEQMKAEAMKQQESLFEETKLQGKKELQDAVETAVEESREAILKITKEAEDTCSKIREQAALKKEEAVKVVIGKVVGEYGSC